MKNHLDNINTIHRADLDDAQYFQSLLLQAQIKGLLHPDELERIQYACLQLLANQTERYNAGDSSSIPIEKAQEIMSSILFTIGVWLKTIPNPDDAVRTLQSETMETLYQKGRRRISTMVASTKAVHTKLLEELVESPNVFYRATLQDGIFGFFKCYDADYAAQEIHITADYPLYHPIAQLEGIAFIKAYVQGAFYENRFCRCFSADRIHQLLCGYDLNYPALLINLYAPVLTAALGCILAETDFYRLDISAAGIKRLTKQLACQSSNETTKLFEDAANQLITSLDLSGGLKSYVKASLPLIIDSVQSAVRTHTIHHIFYTPVNPDNIPKLIVSYGEKMEDTKYRKVIQEIAQCASSQEKYALIKAQVHSLADLEEVLLDADFTDGEMLEILQRQGMPGMTALAKTYLLCPGLDVSALRPQEQRLRICLQHLLSTLPPEQQALLAKAAQL